MTEPLPPRYRERAVYDALRWTGSNTDEVRAFAAEHGAFVKEEDGQRLGLRARIRGGASGNLGRIAPGDWVVGYGEWATTRCAGDFAAIFEQVPAAAGDALRSRIAAAVALWESDGGCPDLVGVLTEALDPAAAAISQGVPA